MSQEQLPGFDSSYKKAEEYSDLIREYKSRHDRNPEALRRITQAGWSMYLNKLGRNIEVPRPNTCVEQILKLESCGFMAIYYPREFYFKNDAPYIWPGMFANYAEIDNSSAGNKFARIRQIVPVEDLRPVNKGWFWIYARQLPQPSSPKVSYINTATASQYAVGSMFAHDSANYYFDQEGSYTRLYGVRNVITGVTNTRVAFSSYGNLEVYPDYAVDSSEHNDMTGVRQVLPINAA